MDGNTTQSVRQTRGASASSSRWWTLLDLLAIGVLTAVPFVGHRMLSREPVDPGPVVILISLTVASFGELGWCIARRRGANPLGGFWLGLALGPFGLFLAASLDRPSVEAGPNKAGTPAEPGSQIRV